MNTAWYSSEFVEKEMAELTYLGIASGVRYTRYTLHHQYPTHKAKAPPQNPPPKICRLRRPTYPRQWELRPSFLHP